MAHRNSISCWYCAEPLQLLTSREKTIRWLSMSVANDTLSWGFACRHRSTKPLRDWSENHPTKFKPASPTGSILEVWEKVIRETVSILRQWTRFFVTDINMKGIGTSWRPQHHAELVQIMIIVKQYIWVCMCARAISRCLYFLVNITFDTRV